MRLQIGSVLALLAYSHSAQAAWPQHYRRQDQQTPQNGTYVPQRLSVASPTNYNVTSVTITYALIPEPHSTTTSSVPTVEVVSSLVVISTYTKTTSLEILPAEETSSTESVVLSSSATRLPYPVSGRPSQSFVVPGNGTYPTATAPAPALSASQTSERTRATPRPKIYAPKHENDTCGGATLNVVNAHLDYWYTETYTHTVSTVSVQFNANDSQTGWTILPATTEFDISTAITQQTCGSSTAINTAFNYTTTDWDCYTTPTPVASSTTLLSVDAFTPTNQTTGNGTQLPNIATEPPLAVATLPSAAGTYTEGTPFVYFSEYEIESSMPTTLPNGSEACAINTRMFLLNRLFSFAFEDDLGELSQENLASEDTTGDIHANFLRLVGETQSVTAGTWSAEPTVIVVVERGVVAQAVLAMSTEVPGGELITPTPTLPDFLSSIDPTTPPEPSTYYSPAIEKTADALDGPTSPTPVKPFNVNRLKTFVAHIEHSDTTLILPVATDTNVITTNIGGQVVTATALSNVMSGGSSSNNNGGSNSNAGSDSNGGSSSNSASNSNGNSNSNSGTNNNGGSNTNSGSGNEENSAGTLSAQGGNTGSNGDDEGDWKVFPFVAHLESSDVTIDVPAPATQKVATIAFEGKTLTATALNAIGTGAGGSNSNGGSNGGSNNAGLNNGASNNGGSESSNGGSNNGGSSNGGSASNNGGGSNGGSNGGSSGAGSSSGNNDNSNGQNANGGVIASLISKITNPAKPTNAAEVLSQALDQGHNDATAAAIVAGLGGIAAGVAAEESDHTGGSGNGGSNNGGTSNGGSGNGQGDSISGSGFSSGSDSTSNNGASGGSNAQPQRLGASPGQIITVNGAQFTASPAQAFVVDGQTVVPGGAPITVDGKVISVPTATNAVVVDGTTRSLDGNFASPTAFDVDGVEITAQPGVGFPIAGQTLQAGGPAITIHGTRLSLAPGGTALVIGSSTSAIAAPAGAASEIPELTIGSQVFTANAATQFFLAAGQTLTPGGTAVVSGTTISLDSEASAIVVNGQTRSFGSSPDATITSPPEIIRVDGQAFAPNAGGTYLISGQTLSPGGSITVTGPNGVETYSLASSGTELVAVVSGHTITSTLDAAAADATAAPIITIGGQTFTALPGSDGTNPTYLVNGELLSAGEEETVTVAGKTYVVSLSPEATLLEVEELGSDAKTTATRIQTLFPATATGRTSTMTASGGSGSGSRTGSGGNSEEGTGVGAAPAQETGAASSSTGAVHLTSLLVAAGTLVLLVLL
jgi:hypothetical protein